MPTNKITMEFEVNLDTPSETQEKARQLVVEGLTMLRDLLERGNAGDHEDAALIGHMLNDCNG